MRENDELQVLGKRRKLSRREKRRLAIITIVFMSVIGLFGLLSYWLSPRRPDRVVAEKGESTIVPELQSAVDSMLNAELTDIDGLQGQAIVMEVQTGQILAMAGLERNFEGRFQPCKNFAYQQELGSLAMTASLLALFEKGIDSVYVVHTGSGIWAVDDNWVMRDHNWRRGGYQDINLSRALEVSSNIGISEPVWKFYRGHEKDFFDDLNKMSFGQPDYIDGIDGLRPTRYLSPNDSNWVNKHVVWSAVGYNRKIAPIQMLTFYNAIANDGKMVKPSLKTGEVEIINPQIARKDNIDMMQVILEHVVSQGIGRRAATPLFKVAGKPGTSQVAEYYDAGDNSLSEYQIGFCGYFPADKPRYSIIVSMNKLGLPASGGGMAGVVFHDIMEWMVVNDLLPLSYMDKTTNDSIKVTKENLDSINDLLRAE